MQISKELYAKMNTLPWQALYEYAINKKIKEEDIKNKEKNQIISKLEVMNLINEGEIDKLIEEYIYGSRVSFSLWRFSEKVTAEEIETLKRLQNQEIECEIREFRNIRIQKVTVENERVEIIYTYSKVYNYTNEQGKSDCIWEQHRGCSWIGLEENYIAYIVKHEKMVKIFSRIITNSIHKNMNHVTPPLSALDRIFEDGVRNKIVLQGIDGEKTAISRSEGLTEEQQEEVKRTRKNRLNTSGSYITPITGDKNATVRYNVKTGNIGVLKHLSSTELHQWTERAIKIIFEEIDRLRGEDAKKIFAELGQEIKWSMIPMKDYSKMNWILTQVMENIISEQAVDLDYNVKKLLNDESLFIKMLRPYCEKCDSYEIAKCSKCDTQISKVTSKCQNCGSQIEAYCPEGHKLRLDNYWFIPSPNCTEMINKNIRKIYPNDECNYVLCITENKLMISNYEDEKYGEVMFDEIDEFHVNNFTIDESLKETAKSMKEKCGKTCSYEKIEKCLIDKEQNCLPKLFYGIIPGFRPQPHKGDEYGDVSGRIKSGGNEYEMKGIIKRRSSNKALLSTSSQGQEIIRQFVEQGMIDARCQLILIVVPQQIDNSFKGTLRFLAKLSNKKVTFVELNEVCKLLRKSNTT